MYFREHQIIVLGELNKWVPMSPQRVQGLRFSASTVSLTLGGRPGEVVTFYYHLDGALKVVNVTLGNPSGCATLTLPPSSQQVSLL